MRRTDTVIIGGGQAGLAMSRCLSDRSVDHVVLERGRVAERWRSERWDSLRLLTPNWQTALPSYRYRGSDPDGFMTMPEVVRYFQGYADSFGAPVECETTVLRVEPSDSGYRVTTDRGVWEARSVVIATGYCDVPKVPEMARYLPSDVLQLTPTRYRSPDRLPEGGVLVVGAAASGIQLADEIHRSGRPVTLAVGKHTRLPRRYRGRDIMYWLDATGIVDETAEEVYDVEASRRQPSLQIVGGRSRLDLTVLQERGVRLAGRAASADELGVNFAPDLAASTASADAKLEGLLARIDRFIERAGLTAEVAPPEPPPPALLVEDAPMDRLPLRAAGIRTVIWATGFERRYPWLSVPVLDGRGELVHRGGVTPAPGLFALGLRFQRRRNSSFIDGVGRDANELAVHLTARLRRDRSVA